jgi:GntR family transcriptional regulator, transcriptional repressor for pyruvate dehydrogenase complex
MPAIPAGETTPPASPFRPVATPRTFEAILRQLKDAIVAGTLRAGDRLPPERELAEQFQVSRATVREAVRVLETLGLVGVRRGADNGSVLLAEPGNAFATILDLLVELRHVPIMDVVEFRVMLESGAARRLAESPAAGVLDDLSSILDRMEADGVSQTEYHELDATFHVTLVRAVDNRLLDIVEAAADSTLRSLIADVALVAVDWPAPQRVLQAEHRGILAAITAGDAGLATERVSAHIRYWGQAIADLRDGVH